MLLHRNESKKNTENYPAISLLSVIYKIFFKGLTTRLEYVLDSVQPREEAYFRIGFRTMHHIQIVKKDEIRDIINLSASLP